MFDLSFGKLAILFALCLIVLGPEKLPRLAQQLGRWTGQARAMARHFRTQLEQEIAAGDLQKQRKELEDAVRSSIDAASAPLSTVSQTVEDAHKSVIEEFDPSAANGSGHGDLSQPVPTGDMDLDAIVAGDFSNQNSNSIHNPSPAPSNDAHHDANIEAPHAAGNPAGHAGADTPNEAKQA
ncbi:MAG TPA: Sec-independent protein translocase protein TatB [Steroidobacteraceae bacterium]|nr:Sec-independent protein translocase protein TatB [Steroidobacteraceae bacterium]